MQTNLTNRRRFAGGRWRGLAAAGLALVIAGCSTGTASPAPSATATVAAATATPTVSDTPTPTPTLAPTPTSVPTLTPSPTHTAAATRTPPPARTPVPTAVPTATPGPLCAASQLVSAVALWETVAAGTQANVMVTTAAGVTTVCYMRGSVEAQMVDGGSGIIADSGPGSATIASSDPFFAVNPGDKFHTSIIWSNWCPKGPSQPVTVALVLPLGLGRVVANTSGPTPVPGCVSSGSPSAVTSGRWLSGV